MAGKISKTKPAGKKLSSRMSANGKVPRYQESIRRHLSKVPGVDAVYTWMDRGIVHVTSVIEDYKEEVFDDLIPMEDLVEKENPKVYFDFHVRARQTRSVESTVPPGTDLVFKK